MDFRVCGRADSVLSQIILDNTSAAEQIPKDAGAASSPGMGRCSRVICSTRNGFKTGGGSYGREAKINDYWYRDPYHEVEALARVLLPEIQAFFESEEGQREFAEWKAQQERTRQNRDSTTGGNIIEMFPP